MALTTRRSMTANPFGDLWNLRRDMADLFDLANSRTEGFVWAPPMNVREDEEALHVELELPGMDPDDVDISIENNVLTISGERTHETQNDEGYHVFERRYGRFSRTLTLSRGIDAENVEARYDRGVLHITLPKPAEAKPRRIKVQTTEQREVGAGQGNGTSMG
jgi:HSP20 family protein